jgi:membrane protein implicated in regulation of membrane protease activity
MLWSQVWWVWVSFGLVLGILEIFLPTFFCLGFGIAAIVTGALIAMGLSVGLAQLLLIYAVLSLISWLLLRRFLQPKSGSVKTFDQDIND